jgi:hypothetical protein
VMRCPIDRSGADFRLKDRRQAALYVADGS